MARVIQKALDFLAPLGLLVMAGAAVASRNGVDLPGGLRPWVFLGVGLVLAHIALRFEDIGRAVGRRQLRHGGNATVLILTVVGILVAVNYLASRRTIKKDFTKNQRYSLSEQTKKVVAELADDVLVVYFHGEGPAQGPGVDRVKELGTLSPRLKVEFVDPMVRPGRAREYGVTSVPTLVLVRGERREKISSDGEGDLVNALIKVTRAGQKTVCFAYGHGEKDVEDFAPTGLSGLKQSLEASNYATKKVLLARDPRVPADCAVAVVAGPQTDLSPAVVEGLRAYVGGGGKVLAMIEPPFKGDTAAYAALLREWNLEAGRDLVVDISPESQQTGFGPESPVAANYPYHAITKDLGRLATLYHTARSLKAGSGAAGVAAQDLAQTFEESWAEKWPVAAGAVRFDDGQDTRGPISLGAVATVPVAAPSPAPASPGAPVPDPSASPGAPAPDPSASPAAEEAAPRREGRVVAFGDSDFASNALLGALGNRDLVLNAVAWLAEDTDLISIRPKEPDDQRLMLSRGQAINVSLLALVVLPGLFVALGLWTWWQRR